MSKKLTTYQTIEQLKETNNHEERLNILCGAGIGQLRKIGIIEQMAHFGRGWTVEKLAERILKQIEARYARIDAGESVYTRGIFGLPIEIDTPLISAYRAKQEIAEAPKPALEVIDEERRKSA